MTDAPNFKDVLLPIRAALERFEKSSGRAEVELLLQKAQGARRAFMQYERDRDKRFANLNAILAARNASGVVGPVATKAPGNNEVRKVWKGPLYLFARFIIKDWAHGRIKADSDRQAVLMEALHYDWLFKNGKRKPLNGYNAWQSHVNKRIAEGEVSRH